MLEVKSAGLYIHVPFCLSKCRYCSFYSVDGTDLSRSIPQYLDALLREMSLYHGFPAVDSVYIGGGTPSLLTPDQLQQIIEAVHLQFTILPDTEWSIECNPGDLNPFCLKALRDIGFNRLTIGVQSLDDDILKWLGRRHSKRDAQNAIEQARRAGFDNIGVDFIYGIPSQSVDSFIHYLKEMMCLNPEHMSCYQLTIEPGTPLFEDYCTGLFKKADEEIELEFFLRTSETLQEFGYLHYEISNFARSESLRSRHNMKYWNHTPYLGLGPAAHSFQGNRRWWNVRSLEQYAALLGEDRLPLENEEFLSDEDLRLETIALRMRTSEGLDLSKIGITMRDSLPPNISQSLHQFAEAGLIRLEGQHLKPTLRGFLVADALALQIDRICR